MASDDQEFLNIHGWELYRLRRDLDAATNRNTILQRRSLLGICSVSYHSYVPQGKGVSKYKFLHAYVYLLSPSVIIVVPDVLIEES